ncbi:MAG TPA: 50S ribosomal protein L7Ae [Candidatus Acidoferrum sp.]|nr:50S ribosomal protein L7Ae [Candidatus Acidoferrum sp.]
MAKTYVKFEVSNEVVAKTYEALQLAKQSGVIKKGANEVTKSVERGLATFVVMAGDIEPEEVVMHIPMLCEQKKIPYSYVPTKQELGKAIGLIVPCAAIAVEGQGTASALIKDVVGRVTGSAPKSAAAPKPEQPKAERKPAPKKEAAPKPQPAAPMEEKEEE